MAGSTSTRGNGQQVQVPVALCTCMDQKTDGSVEKALQNLESIKSGEDPRARVQADTQTSTGPSGTYEIEEHEDVRRLFVEVVNVVQPEHPYLDEPYPVEYDDFEWSYCRASSNTWARCGPGHGPKVAKFYDDINYFSNRSIGRVLAILVHEATHITEGRHSEGSIHNPTFWQKYARNARTLRENLDALSTAGVVDVEEFEHEVVHDVNSAMTDRRSRTVEEQKKEVRKILGAYHVEVGDGSNGASPTSRIASRDDEV